VSVHLDHTEFEANSSRLVINNFFDVDDDSITQIRHRFELCHKEAGHGGVRTAGKVLAGLIGEFVEGF
jgi:hypothetical protein